MNNPKSTGSGGVVETDDSSGASKDQLEKPRYELLNRMKDLWKQQNKEEVCKTFREALSSMDPRVHHSFVLDLIGHIPDLYKRLAFLILGEFDTMLSVKKITEEELTIILTPELRMQALQLAASAHPNVFDILSKLYYLQAGPDNSFLVSRVGVMLAKQQFKEAYTCVTKLKLHNYFSLEDICIPVILQDRASMHSTGERYVKGLPELQKALVRQLDVFCEESFDMKAYLSEMKISVRGVKVEKLKSHHMTKLILRLVKTFKLDMSICPNTAKSEAISAIKYLIDERYIKKSMSQDAWEELIISTIGDNKSVQSDFIDQLVRYDVSAAARWARHYGINVNQLPEDVFEELQRSDASVDYYPLNTRQRIILVTTEEDIERCLTDITSKCGNQVCLWWGTWGLRAVVSMVDWVQAGPVVDGEMQTCQVSHQQKKNEIRIRH